MVPLTHIISFQIIEVRDEISCTPVTVGPKFMSKLIAIRSNDSIEKISDMATFSFTSFVTINLAMFDLRPFLNL
ncbi:unnamed protein product [Rotaria sp. Silwood2]|nr:unnamed protein product [Rotaria sp. Silwood2]CAF4116135.1 unnamed protein product [Rotaria sp. Silwood2]